MKRRPQATLTLGSILNSTWTALGYGLLLFCLVVVGMRLVGRMEATPAISPAPKMASSSIAITSDGAVLLAVNPDSNSITFIEPDSQTAVLELPVGIDPRAVAITPDDTRAYVANQGSDTLSVLDLGTGMVMDEIVVGDRPVGVTVSPDGRLVAVAELGDDAVRFLRADDHQVLSLIGVKDRPHGLAFTPDARYLLVSHLLSGDVSVLAVPPFQIYLPLILSSVGEKTGILETPVQVVRTDSFDQVQVIATLPDVAPAPAVVINAASTRAYLPQTMAHGQGLNTQFDNTVFPKVSVLNLESWQHQTSEYLPLPELDRPVGLPWDVALTPAEDELWVVNAASNDISVLDISDPTKPTRVANIPVGDNPRGIVFSPDGTKAFVNNVLAGTVSVLDTSTYTETAVISTTSIPLPPLLLHGKRLFHSSARSDLAQAAWISCNTCHVEGEHDGRTWLLQFAGTVPPGATPVITRNTTSLLGMIETYPLRWSAEWDESADSEFSVRFEQFGSGLIHDDDMHPPLGEPNQGRSYDLDALAAYIDSLSLPDRSHPLTTAQERGRLLFESPETLCTDCHPAPLYTDLQTHDVGTADFYGEWFGPFIDTPTLRVLHDSAPYLHDGSAATLYQVLTSANPLDAHGVTSHLTEAEIADLIDFLLVLPHQK